MSLVHVIASEAGERPEVVCDDCGNAEGLVVIGERFVCRDAEACVARELRARVLTREPRR